MKNVLTYRKPIFIVVLFALFIGTASWQARSKSKLAPRQNITDTVKPGNNSTDQDEFRLEELDKAMKELNDQMKKLNEEFSNGKFDKAIKEAMEKVDWKKMQAELKASMEKIDWKKMQLEMEKAMKDAELAMKNIDMNKLEKEMEQLQERMKNHEVEMKINSEKIKQKVEESMKKAKVEMEKAKEEMKLMKAFTDELEKDGLINKKKGYKVEVKNNELYINGTKQSKETSEKYRKYYRKDNFTINTNGDTIIEI